MSPVGFAMSELSKVVQRCNPDFDAARAISWQVEGPVAESWQQWMKGLFEPLLLPHILRVLDFSARQSAREIILLDAELHRSLQPWPRQHSLEAGRSLLQQSTPRGERVTARLQEAIQNWRCIWAFCDFVCRPMRARFRFLFGPRSLVTWYRSYLSARRTKPVGRNYLKPLSDQ
jgi:hypothetical protein